MSNVYVSRNAEDLAAYNKFVAYANGNDVTDKTNVVLNDDGSDKLLKSANGINAGKGGQNLRQANNEVRDNFKASVCRLFHVAPEDAEKRLPSGVMSVFKASDKFKPLSVRQIKAVDTEVKKIRSLFVDIDNASVENDLMIAGQNVSDAFDKSEILETTNKFDKKGGAFKDKVLFGLLRDCGRDNWSTLSGKKDLPKFRANPNIVYNKPGGTYRAHLFNGRLCPVTPGSDKESEAVCEKEMKKVERFINFSFAAENDSLEKCDLKENRRELEKMGFDFSQAGNYKAGDCISLNKSSGKKLIFIDKNTVKLVDAEQQKDLRLYHAASNLVTQAAFSMGVTLSCANKNNMMTGRPIYDPNGAQTSTANIVPSKPGPGYDVIVRQCFNSVTGKRKKAEDDNGTSSHPRKVEEYYDPMKPGTLTVTVAYHVELQGGVPKVTYKNPPEAKIDFPKVISEKKFKSQVAKFLKTHLQEILKEEGGGEEWWSRFTKAEKAEIQNKAVDEMVRQANEEAEAVSIPKLQSVISNLAKEIAPSKDTLKSQLKAAQASVDTVFADVNKMFAKKNPSTLAEVDSKIFKPLAVEANEIAKSERRLTDDEEESFAEGDVAKTVHKRTVRGYMLGGKQIPTVPQGKISVKEVTDHFNKFLPSILDGGKRNYFPINDTVAHQFEIEKKELTGRKGDIIELFSTPDRRATIADGIAGGLRMDAKSANSLANNLVALICVGDAYYMYVTKDDLALSRVAAALSKTPNRTMLESIIQGEERKLGGKLCYDNTERTVTLSNVVPSKSGKGYDIVVHESIRGITSVGRKKGMGTVLFKPMDPAKLTVDYVYHIEMDGNRPKVTFKETPKVKFTGIEWISRSQFKKGVQTYYEDNQKEIEQGESMQWFHLLQKDTQESLRRQAYGQALKNAKDRAVSVAGLRKCIADAAKELGIKS